WCRKTFPCSIEPHGRWPRQNPDAVFAPDRIPILDAFGIMPHPVPVDDAPAGFFRNGEHPAIDMLGYSRQHGFWRFPHAARPVFPDQVMVASDAAACYDDGLCFASEIGDYLPRTGFSPLGIARLQQRPHYTGHHSIFGEQFIHLMSRPIINQSVLHMFAYPPFKRLNDSRSCSPDDMEARHRIAVPFRQITAAFSPANDWKESDAHSGEPAPLFICCKIHIRLRPFLAPVIFILLPVETGCPKPILPSQFF